MTSAVHGGATGSGPRQLTGVAVGLVGALVLMAAGCGRGGSSVVVLEGATLFDGSGGRPVEDAVIVVRDGYVEAVARVGEIDPPRGATVLSLIGKSIIPGLIDASARLQPWAAPRFLAWGVTTVRDFGADTATAYELHRSLNSDSALGPRVYTTGGVIDGARPADARADTAATPDAGRRAVDRRALAATEWISVQTGVTPEVLAAVLDEASTFRLPTAASLGRTDALTAARRGVASIEGLSGIAQAAAADAGLLYAAYSDPALGWRAEAVAWARLDSLRIANIARALAETRVSLVPTLIAAHALARLGDSAFVRRTPMADVPDTAASVRDVAAYRRRLNWSAADAALVESARRAQVRFLVEFRQAGGLMGAGSGAASPLLIPGFSLHEELALLVDAGFAPASAIATATRRNAQLLRADSLGWIAPGKVADLVILNGRPDSSILATRDIHLVMARGRLVDPDSLRRSWQR